MDSFFWFGGWVWFFGLLPVPDSLRARKHWSPFKEAINNQIINKEPFLHPSQSQSLFSFGRDASSSWVSPSLRGRIAHHLSWNRGMCLFSLRGPSSFESPGFWELLWFKRKRKSHSPVSLVVFIEQKAFLLIVPWRERKEMEKQSTMDLLVWSSSSSLWLNSPP